MRHVISTLPTIDVSALASRLARGRAVMTDPSKALCQRYGYQTLYEIPIEQQKQLRRQLIREHAMSLQADPDGVFDHAVFAWLADWMRWLWSETSAEEWETVLAEAKPAVALSETIHHVVSGPPASYDGYRWLERRNAVQVERLLHHLYRDFGCEARVTEASSADMAADRPR